MAASAIGNWASSSGGMPADDLYPANRSLRNDSMTRSVAQPTCVAPSSRSRYSSCSTRPDTPDSGIAVAPEDRRPRREVRPEQLVGGVDEVELHDPSGPIRARASISSRRFSRSRWKIDRRIGAITRAPRCGNSGGTIVSVQRAVVVGSRRPSALDSSCDHALPGERALVADREPAGPIERGDRDRVEDRDPEDPDVALGLGADARGRRSQDADRLHVVHPARLALDVGQDVPDALDRRPDDQRRQDRRRLAVRRLGTPGSGPRSSRRRHPRSRTRSRNRIMRGTDGARCPRLAARRGRDPRRPAGRRPRRWRRSGPSSRTRGRRHRARSP